MPVVFTAMKNLPSNRASLLIRARSSARTLKWLIIEEEHTAISRVVLAIFGLRCFDHCLRLMSKHKGL